MANRVFKTRIEVKRPFATGNIHGSGDVDAGIASGFLNGTFRGPCMNNLIAGATAVEFLFANYGPDDTPGPYPLEIGCNIEQGANNWPLTFHGRQLTTIDPGGSVWSDPAALDLDAGFFWPRTYVNPGATGRGFRCTFVMSPALGEGGNWAASGTTDQRGSTGMLYFGSSTELPSYPAFGPIAARAILPDGARLPAMYLHGDSLAVGTGENGSGEDVMAAQGYPRDGKLYRSYYRGGWITRGLAERLPSVLAARGGLGASASLRRVRSRMSVPMADHAIISLLTNDWQANTVVACQANIIAVWNSLANLGVKVWQPTLMPAAVTSSDGFATLANQTIQANDSRRQSLNAWLRAGAPVDPVTKTAVAIGTAAALPAGAGGHPLTGVLDPATLVESGSTGKWRVAYTDDGTHPNAAGATAAAAVLADLTPFAIA